MEYVDGNPITEYCAQNGLNVPQRLRLFREFCGAVQYAHGNLVVHRDLKPGNILVTREGIPKLLDFGLPKVVNPETTGEATMTGLRMLLVPFPLARHCVCRAYKDEMRCCIQPRRRLR